jgi:hypothetical protein
MKQYMTNQLKTDETALRGIDARAAGPTSATVVLAPMEHPTGPVQVTGQKPRHGEGE